MTRVLIIDGLIWHDMYAFSFVLLGSLFSKYFFKIQQRIDDKPQRFRLVAEIQLQKKEDLQNVLDTFTNDDSDFGLESFSPLYIKNLQILTTEVHDIKEVELYKTTFE